MIRAESFNRGFEKANRRLRADRRDNFGQSFRWSASSISAFESRNST